MTEVGETVYSSGLAGKVIRVLGLPPREQIYVDWQNPVDRALAVNPEALSPSPEEAVPSV